MRSSVQHYVHGPPMENPSMSVIKRHPVHFILNPGYIEYELGDNARKLSGVIEV